MLLTYFQEEVVYFQSPNRSFSPCPELMSSEIVKHNQTHMYYNNTQKSDILVIFYHGNGNVVCDVAFLGDYFIVRNADFIFPEYIGYGVDIAQVKPSHVNTKQTVRDVS